MPGWTVCSRMVSVACALQYCLTSSPVILPSTQGTGSTLWPVASIAPVSWQAMCPSCAASTPW